MIADFSYYKPLNAKQQGFHDSRAMHKLLMGGYRGGKTYPAMHEAFMMCGDQPPGCEFLVARNTWDSLKDNVEKDMLAIAESANAIKDWNKTDHDLLLWNDVKIKFRPLTLSRAQFKGMNLFGFLIDDPDETLYADIMGFLFTRLTNPPGVQANYFGTLFCANYEGHGWLWKTFIKGKPEGGDGTFAYWIMETEDNTTLHPGYMETLSAIHSQAWMDRYTKGKLDSYTGLVYNEYSPAIHDKQCHNACMANKDLIKITSTDVGITHPSVVLSMATDYKHIYIYDEMYETNLRTDDLAQKTVDIRLKQQYIDHIIDPTSAKREQTSGTSVKKDLWDRFKLRYTDAVNVKKQGIELVKSLLTPRDAAGNIDMTAGQPIIYIDPVYCPNTVRELELYRWKEPKMMDFDELAYNEEPIKKDDDCMDCLKYGAQRLLRYLKGYQFAQKLLQSNKEEIWKNRINLLKHYHNAPSEVLARSGGDNREKVRLNQRINSRIKAYEKQQAARAKRFRALSDASSL